MKKVPFVSLEDKETPVEEGSSSHRKEKESNIKKKDRRKQRHERWMESITINNSI